MKDRAGTKGYFKFPVTKQWKNYRILLANEYIAAELAGLVGLPAAGVKEISVKGPKGRRPRGIVSLRATAREVIPWKKASPEVHQNPERHVQQSELLAQLAVFDAWIMNPDRTNRNLILYRDQPEDRYRWYLIDHGLALFGSPEKWKAKRAKRSQASDTLFPRTNRRKTKLRVPAGLKRFTSENRAAVSKMIEKIQALSSQDVSKAIKKVPPTYLKRLEKDYIKRVLRSRQKMLPAFMEEVLAKIDKNRACRPEAGPGTGGMRKQKKMRNRSLAAVSHLANNMYWCR
ncbi:HipA family kinase [Brevibacillus borstelensis]|uniref:HipA family kinase n=1 Tax=Brevibacillus borstelensis TaxID=45462 RepID=UPI0030BAAA80